MPAVRQTVPAAPAAAFARLRAELDLPGPFAPDVLRAAEQAAKAGPAGRREDRTDLPMVTVDPPGSRDLDQALLVEHHGRSMTAWYAIADLAAFVRPGDPVDTEARARGRTVYLPDGSVPLHPRVLSEDAASLLPGERRPALLWRIALDADGEVTAHEVRRAWVRSRAQLDYETAQRATATPGSTAAALLELGRRRQEQEWRRGGISLNLPDQRVDLVDGAPQVRLRQQLPIEEANAQLSLLVGSVAAQTMVDAGLGVLRTLPRPRAHHLDDLRADAHALGAPWPEAVDHATFLRTLHASTPRDAALLVRATRVLRGAGYLTLGEGVQPVEHGAVASYYSHVTAPIRRLVDRYAHEVLLAVVEDRPVPEEVLAVLPSLPREMDVGGSRASAAERATTDLAEAVLLSDRVGETLRAVPVRHRDGWAEVRVVDPPVIGRVDGAPPLGTEIAVVVEAVDVDARRVDLALVAVGDTST